MRNVADISCKMHPDIVMLLEVEIHACTSHQRITGIRPRRFYFLCIVRCKFIFAIENIGWFSYAIQNVLTGTIKDCRFFRHLTREYATP